MSKYCGNCGNKIDERAYICPKCGVIVNSNLDNVNNVSVDNGGMGWWFLGFFFPVVGLILYLVWKDNKPKSARSAGKGALISVIVNIVITVIMFILLLLFNTYSFTIANEYIEDNYGIDDYDEYYDYD